MKNCSIALLLIFVSVINFTNAELVRNILWNEFEAKNSSIDKSLNGINEWRNKLKEQIEENLVQIPSDVKKLIVEKADNENKESWPSLTVSQYLEFTVNGNRNHFEGSRGKRRTKLIDLVIGELITGKGKYINEILNGLWLILEESTWVLPAHLYIQNASLGLPDPAEYVIDLGVAGTAVQLAWIQFVMKEKLAKISPMIIKRIDFELERRVVRPFLDNSHMWWMGFDGQKVNNWNVYINANILTTVLLTVDDSDTRNQFLEKSIQSVDKFINGYPNDGGCDEGPSYWGMAGGQLIEFIDILTSYSDHHLDWSSNSLIHSIGSYIYNIHIDENKFVNFADASALLIPDPSKVLKYGSIFNDEKLKQFASYLDHLLPEDNSITVSAQSGDLHSFFTELASHQIFKTIQSKAPQPLQSWLPDLQVITLRSLEGSAKGIFLGAKAGTNDESHNHNDVGNFVLYVDGMPAIIDVGVGTYTAQTFSKDRYKLWNMQSQWHNTPTINGVQQHNGPQYVSRNVKYTQTPSGGLFEADIAGAYPTEAEVKSWVRKFAFDRTANTVTLKESYQLNKYVQQFKVHFMIALNETHANNGQINLTDGKVSLIIEFDSNAFDITIDKPVIDDNRISNVWGQRLSRITLVSKSKNSTIGEFSTTFKLK